MKTILNGPRNDVDEMLAGLIAAHPEYDRLHGDTGTVIARAAFRHMLAALEED